jgi:hypothetical protein
MVVTLTTELEAVVRAKASEQGISPEMLALKVLRDYFLSNAPPQPRDDWERGLLAAARNWGVSFSNAALSSEGLYD